jgi:hypothetical protein
MSRQVSKCLYRALSTSIVRPVRLTTSTLMSKVDSEMVNYVNDQLGHETARTIPTIKGWSECVIEGALGSMSKQHGNETIKVRFSTNGIMPSLEDQDELEERGKEVLCYPAFEVVCERPGKKSIFVACQMENPALSNEDDSEDADPYEIINISVGSEDDESPYILNMDVMEDEFYDGILGFLEERGITDEFIENLCHVATDIENNKYRDLLLGLKDFVQ